MNSLSALLLLAALPLGSPSAQIAGGRSPLASGGGLSTGQPRSGALVAKPGGGEFLWDLNRGGRGGELGLAEVRWGRLVDVHALDAGGQIELRPVFRDFLIDPNLVPDGVDYELHESAATGLVRLVVRRARTSSEFLTLLTAAAHGTVELEPRALVAPVHALVPRNAALVLRFDDLLDDSPAAVLDLANRVLVRAGAGATLPHSARVRFDANHGGLSGGAFHATRVLVDLALSEFEASALVTPQPLSPSGVPAGPEGGFTASLALRLPTRPAPGAGQFEVLRNLAGRPLAQSGNGPIDTSVASADLVRGARAGNDSDAQRGFLFDASAPRPVGTFPLTVVGAVPDPAGELGFGFLLDWTFTSPCFARPLLGDALQVGDLVLEVVANGPSVGGSGAVAGVRVRLANASPTTAANLLGNGLALALYRPTALASECWFGVQPTPGSAPDANLSPDARFSMRFSEPMAPESFDPYSTWALVEGLAAPGPDSLVAADSVASASLTSVALVPLQPLAHVPGEATPYALQLPGLESPTDLAGNPLATALAGLFRLDPAAPEVRSDALVLTFTSLDELPPLGASDVRGPVFLDVARGELRGRPATHFSAGVERTNPVTSIQIPFTLGVSAPLTPLGAKLQSVWRYADLGWSARDESKYDVDVEGLNWAPLGGLAVSDFFPQFEIRLAHARNLPDEALDRNLLPRYPSSGLPGSSTPFADNPLGPQAIVHPKSAGYVVNPATLFVSPNGTPMLPYPLNEGPGPDTTYTWRDTALELAGGPNGAGVPLDLEVGAPLFLEPTVGTLAPPGEVPSIGLALLMEFRCYPTSQAIGLNRFDTNLAINSSALPAFRAYSAGGIDRFGQPVTVDPDTETNPLGTFNPASTPPGQRTLANDDVVYLGQLDLVYRVSRALTVWIDTHATTPDFTLLQQRVAGTSGTSVTVELRGATGFSDLVDPFDATRIDAYGALAGTSVSFLNGSDAWHSDVNALDGARYVQLRISLVNHLASGASPALDSLALLYTR